MSNLSNYAEAKIIDHVFRTASFAKPATLYFALFTTIPGEDGAGGVEVSGGNYGRIAVTGSDANFTAPADAAPGRKTQNANPITFGAPSAAWGTVVGYGVYDATSGGNLLALGSLSASKVIGASDPAPEFPAGAFVFTARLGTTVFNDKILNHLFRTTAFAKPTNVYFGLYTAAPTDAGGGTEVSTAGTAYARATVACADANFSAPVAGDGHTENASDIAFAAPTANWGAVLAAGVFDAVTAGNLWLYDDFPAVNVNNGDAAPKIAAGQFDYTVA